MGTLAGFRNIAAVANTPPAAAPLIAGFGGQKQMPC